MPSSENTPLLGSSNNPPQPARQHWRTTLNPRRTKLPLAIQCFNAGLADCISYSTVQTWVAFMTGNLTQVALSSVAVIHQTDQEKNTRRILFSGLSVVGFCIGAFGVSRFMAGHLRSRLRLVFNATAHVLITTVVILIVTLSDMTLKKDPLLVFLLAISMGSQSAASISLGAHPYSTTVVFTNPLTQVCADRYFPSLLVPIKPSRDEHESDARHRALSIVLLMSGAVVGAVILEWVNVTGALVALAASQAVVALAWALAEGEQEE